MPLLADSFGGLIPPISEAPLFVLHYLHFIMAILIALFIIITQDSYKQTIEYDCWHAAMDEEF